MEKIGLISGIIGGIGLGLMSGSEYPGRWITLLGAGLVIIFLITLGILSYQSKKK